MNARDLSAPVCLWVRDNDLPIRLDLSWRGYNVTANAQIGDTWLLILEERQ